MTDFLVYKLDTAGAKQWRKNFGGDQTDTAKAVVQTSDGGYVVAGYSSSYTSLPVARAKPAEPDFLVYRLNSAGQKLWRKNYGGSSSDRCFDVRQTSDGGFILFGYSYSYSNGLSDFLAYKVNAAGQKLWRKNYGGSEYDYGYFAEQTADGGYIFFGEGDSYAQSEFDSDFLVYKVNAAGAKEWRKNYGGEEPEYLEAK
jgi:hypothetical protein